MTTSGTKHYFSRLISPASFRRLQIVGEAHSHPLHHRLQFNLIEALDSLRAENMVLAGNGKPEPLGENCKNGSDTPP
jgi:uncharacterized iron-regulated protein